MTEPSASLFTTSVGAPDTARQRIVMLHGIYGRGRNWQAIARELVRQRPDWSALLTDLRLHGESPAMTPPHNLMAAAGDVQRLIAASGEPPVRVVLGHSFGGKVALALGALRPADAPDGAPAAVTLGLRQIWVIDATPATHAPAGSAWDMLRHVRALPPAFAARQDGIDGLVAQGWPTGVASWMATNLRFADGQYRWALDFDAMEALLHSYFTTDLWAVIESPPPGLELHIVKAQGSNTINEAACDRIDAAAAATGRVHLHRVEGSHWLNADNPQALIELLSQHLPSQPS